MSKWLKMAFLAALLLGTGYFFGTVCRQVGQVYELILPPSRDLLGLLLRFLLAMGTVAVTAGLVAALVRPVWIGIITFAFSGLTMLLGWKVTVGSGLLILMYLLAASLYAVGVARELNQRIRFSVVRPIGGGQGVLLIALVLVACGSLYFGYAAHIEQEGFSSYLDPIIEIFVGQMEKQLVASVPEEQRQEPEFETRLAELRKEMQRNIAGFFERTVKPYEPLIPLAAAAGLFMLLANITPLLSWVSITVLSVVFPLLKALGITKEVSETREVHRLIIA
jgi:hypothetical protein